MKPTLKKVEKAIRGYCEEHLGGAGDLIVRTPKDAANYCEYASKKAICWVSIDGCPLYGVLNFHNGSKAFDKFQEFMDGLGIWFECGHAWNFNVYSQEDQS
jgi:hypothetical protein